MNDKQQRTARERRRDEILLHLSDLYEQAEGAAAEELQWINAKIEQYNEELDRIDEEEEE